MRETERAALAPYKLEFPFLFGGTFIEGQEARSLRLVGPEFPFLFGGTFIEGISYIYACF